MRKIISFTLCFVLLGLSTGYVSAAPYKENAYNDNIKKTEENIALYKPVDIFTNTSNSTYTYSLTDGDLATNVKFISMSTDTETNNRTNWLRIDLGKEYSIGRIEISGNQTGYTIQDFAAVSFDVNNNELLTPDDYSAYSESATRLAYINDYVDNAIKTSDFNTDNNYTVSVNCDVSGRYVLIHRGNANGNPVVISEIKVYEKKEIPVNIAQEKSVLTNTSPYSTSMGVENLTDGNLSSLATANQSTTDRYGFVIDLGARYTVTKIEIYARKEFTSDLNYAHCYSGSVEYDTTEDLIQNYISSTPGVEEWSTTGVYQDGKDTESYVNDGIITYTGERDARYIVLSKKASSGLIAAYEVKVFGEPLDAKPEESDKVIIYDAAAGKPVTAGNLYSDSFSGDNLVDGNPDSFAASKDSGDRWFKIDLGEVKDIRGFSWTARSTGYSNADRQQVEICYSVDDVDVYKMKPIYAMQSGDVSAGTTYYRDALLNARYIAIRKRSDAGNTLMACAEFKVFAVCDEALSSAVFKHEGDVVSNVKADTSYTAEFSGASKTGRNFIALVCQYNENGLLISCTPVESELAAGQDTTLSIPFTRLSDTKTVKVVALDTISNGRMLSNGAAIAEAITE